MLKLTKPVSLPVLIIFFPCHLLSPKYSGNFNSSISGDSGLSLVSMSIIIIFPSWSQWYHSNTDYCYCIPDWLLQPPNGSFLHLVSPHTNAYYIMHTTRLVSPNTALTVSLSYLKLSHGSPLSTRPVEILKSEIKERIFSLIFHSSPVQAFLLQLIWASHSLFK